MAELLNRETIAEQAIVHDAPPAPGRNMPVDRTFELPSGIYKATVGLYLGFIALMAFGFGNPELIVPMVMFAFIIVAGFYLPTIWANMQPESPVKSKTWQRFSSEGIMTAYGRTSARDACVQVLILPVLIFFWGVCALIIAALV